MHDRKNQPSRCYTSGGIFNAERPNQKWVTDISYIKTAQGFLYLSIIRDLYDNSIVAYKMDKEQRIKLVLDTIKTAKRKEKITAEVQLHSDQGFWHTSQAYFNLTQSYDIRCQCQDVVILMDLHYSQTDGAICSGDSRFKYLMNLHYSQTVG